MNDPRIPEGLVEEIAEDHGFDPVKLYSALMEALDSYEDERDFWTWREGAYSVRGDITRVLTAVRRASRKWMALPPTAREEVRFFQGGDEDDPVGPRLQFVVDLLDEYGRHYSKPRGNPGHARDRDGGDLKPLEAYARVLMRFWMIEKNEPFGHVVERAYEADGSNDESAPRVIESKGLDFLSALATCLPHAYSVGNLETVVRNIKKDTARTRTS